ncbi:MAG: tRNA pseudouridine(55) synthase TruB [Aerococcaceae bacterium]|nr:tRNA pseudouridine(55) synthase TruB [Aerococcaceae bacterium]
MWNGILPIWKEAGMTSHDVVFKLRKLLRMKKIGHTGTLDPQVDGVLVICLGEATKLVELLMDGDKHYVGEITLGISTETEDAHGAVVERLAVEQPFSIETIDETMQHFHGEIEQIPPYYSAVKVNGKRLYEYARQGLQVERPRRIARIDAFERVGAPIYDAHNQTQRWHFSVQCGKGTYVRTLAVDLGKKLGYPSHMSQLTRFATGGFTKEQAFTLTQLAQLVENGNVEQALYPIEYALKKYPTYELTQSEYEQTVRHGQVVAADYFGERIETLTALYYGGRVVALYAPHPTKINVVKPFRMFQQLESE